MFISPKGNLKHLEDYKTSIFFTPLKREKMGMELPHLPTTISNLSTVKGTSQHNICQMLKGHLTTISNLSTVKGTSQHNICQMLKGHPYTTSVKC